MAYSRPTSHEHLSSNVSSHPHPASQERIFSTFASSSSASYNIHEAHYGAGAAFTLGWGNDESGMPFDGPLASTSSTAVSASILHGWSPPAFTPSPSFTASTSASTISQRPGSGLLTPSGFSHHEAREGGTIDSEPSVELTFSGLFCETNAKTTDAPTLCEADTLSVSADFNMTRAVQEVVDEMRFAGLPTGRLRGIQDENGSHVGTTLHLGARTNDGITASPISTYEYDPSSSLTRDRFDVALPGFTTAVYPHVAFAPISSAEITRYSPLALHHPQPLPSFSGLGPNAAPDMNMDPLRLSSPATHVYEPSSQVRNGVLHYSATGPFSQTVATQGYERPLSSTVPPVPLIVLSAYPPVYSQSIDQNDSHGRTGHVRRNRVGVTPYGATPARTYASARLPLNVRSVAHASSSTGPDIYAQGLVHMEDRPGQSTHHDSLAQAFGSFSRPAAAMPTVETHLRLDVREYAPAPCTSFNALAFPLPRAGPYGVLSPFQSGQPSREQIELAISAAKRRPKLVYARTSGTSSKTEVFPMHAGFDIPPYQAPDVRQLDERLYPHRFTHNVEATAEFVHSHLGWYEDGQKTATGDQNKLKRRGPISCDACIGTHRKCAYTSKPGMAFIRYHCAHPRAGEPGYIAYRHGVVLYPAEVSKCTPIVYVPFVRCPQAQKQGEWSVFDLTRKDKEIHHVCTTHLPGPSNYFVPLSPGQRAPNLPFVTKGFTELDGVKWTLIAFQ